MYPKAYVVTSFIQDDWRIRNNLTLNLGARYDIEFIKNVPDYPAPADKDNFDPRRHRLVHAAAPDLHDRQGRRRRPERPGDAEPDADQPAVPDLPERDSVTAGGHGAADPVDPGDFANPRE